MTWFKRIFGGADTQPPPPPIPKHEAPQEARAKLLDLCEEFEGSAALEDEFSPSASSTACTNAV